MGCHSSLGCCSHNSERSVLSHPVKALVTTPQAQPSAVTCVKCVVPCVLCTVTSCRQKVLEWLADLGAVELAEDHEVSLPQLAPHHWQQLHSNNPMMMKPALDRYTTQTTTQYRRGACLAAARASLLALCIHLHIVLMYTCLCQVSAQSDFSTGTPWPAKLTGSVLLASTCGRGDSQSSQARVRPSQPCFLCVICASYVTLLPNALSACTCRNYTSWREDSGILSGEQLWVPLSTCGARNLGL
jgi:hypothetical protein